LALVICFAVGGVSVAAPPVPAAYLRIPNPTLVPSREALREQVKEPLFAFVLSMIAADSVGTWTAADLEAFAAAWGGTTDFPLGRLVSISREVVPPEQRKRHEGVEARRRLVITMQEDRFEFPMPYSILGYHPGTVVVKSPLVFDEWAIGPRTIEVRVDGAKRQYAVDALTVFQITGGANYLDLDAWLDNLLGDVVDDSWTLAFVAGWEDDRLVGIAVSTGRKGRRIFGELDFRTGEVRIHDRPVVRGLAAHVREWVTADEIASPRPWQDD
jgi:hypothetical protein